MNGKGFVRPAWVGQIGIAAMVALLACFVGIAVAATGGAGNPGRCRRAPRAAPPAPPPPPPAPATISLVAATTTPRKSFYFGYRYPRLSYTIASTQPENDLQIDVLNSTGEVVKTFYRENIAPDVENKVRWDGTTTKAAPHATAATASGSARSRRPRRRRRRARRRARPPSALASPSTATPFRSSAPTNTG